LIAMAFDVFSDAFGAATTFRGLTQNAAEQPAGERAPRNQSKPKCFARRNDFQLDGARVEVVEALLADQPQHLAPRGDAVGLGNVPGGEVAAADVDDLAFTDELLHRLPDLVPRCIAINVMHLIEIDAIGAQAPQAVLAGTLDVICGQAALVGAIAHAPEHFSRQDDALTPRPALVEPAPDDLLGDPFAGLPAVDIRGIEEVDAVFEGAVHDCETVRLRGERSEVHRAQAQSADF